MSNPEMVERVAKALGKAIEDRPYELIPQTGPNAGPLGVNLRAIAAVAIAAMREPTESMAEAEAAWEHTGDPCWLENVKEAWRAAIDAAQVDEP